MEKKLAVFFLLMFLSLVTAAGETPSQQYKWGERCCSAGNYAEAMRWWCKAAERGHASAQNNLGACYYFGKGVSKDLREAAKWYRREAEQGVDQAQFNLGNCYYCGEGVTKDYAEAAKWYRRAAERGYVDAWYNLGVCYHKGDGVPRDSTEAAYWFCKAAKQGVRRAQEACLVLNLRWK